LWNRGNLWKKGGKAMEADDCRVQHRYAAHAIAIAIAAAETETGRKRYFAHSLNEKP
jgi:hypothetical protein